MLTRRPLVSAQGGRRSPSAVVQALLSRLHRTAQVVLAPSRPGVSVVFAVALLALIANGCSHRPAAVAGEGDSSFKFVPPPRSQKRTAATPTDEARPAQAVIPAAPIGTLAVPRYPKSVPAAEAGVVFVTVRVTVDATGRVSDVSPSLASISTPSPHAAEFRAAVEAAVAQWRFEPAELRRFKWTETPAGSELVETRVEFIATAFDVSFTFSPAGVTGGLPRK